MDTQAFAEFNYPNADVAVTRMRDARIPMRDKTGTGGICHFKTIVSAGQEVVQFSSAYYSAEAFVQIE